MTSDLPRTAGVDAALASAPPEARGGAGVPAPAAASTPSATPLGAGCGLPAEMVAADEAMRSALGVAGCADEWPAVSRASVLAWVCRQRDVLAALEARVLTAERDAGTWGLRGDRDLAGFVGRTSRTGRGAGLAAVGRAGTLAAMPVVAEALVDGPVTATHVAQITRATAASPVLAAELASAAGQAQLVELAGRLDGGEFGKALAQLSASLDPAGRQRTHDEQRAGRSFAWTHTPAGTLVKGRLDTVAGHKLAKAIDALCARPTVDDDRSREMRQADALLALVERAAADRTTTPGAVAPVQAIITFTQDTWTALRAAHDEENRAVPGSAVQLVGLLREKPAVTDETGQPWPASEVARALCDCGLTRAVAGTRDADLNLGRESRAFTRRHWLALYAAGITGCQVPGCGMPLAFCELHHIAWWQRDNGLTNLANCAAYCSYHHHEIHRLGIVVTRGADGTLRHHHRDGRPYGGAPVGDGAAPAEAPSPQEPAGPRVEHAPVPTDRIVAGTAPPGRRAQPGTTGAAPPPPRDAGGGVIGSLPDSADGSPRAARPCDALPGRATVTGHREADGPPADLLDLLDLLDGLSA